MSQLERDWRSRVLNEKKFEQQQLLGGRYGDRL